MNMNNEQCDRSDRSDRSECRICRISGALQHHNTIDSARILSDTAMNLDEASIINRMVAFKNK